MICFCYFCQKRSFSILGVTHNDPFSVQIGSEKAFFKRFYQLFFRTAGLQHKLLILIVSPNIFHWKSAKESKVGVVFVAKFGSNQVQCCEKKHRNCHFDGVFFILCVRYTFTSKKIVVIEISEQKLKTILARNTIFVGNQDKMFAHFGSKIAKSDYVRGFNLVSQSLSHILGNNITTVFLRD